MLFAVAGFHEMLAQIPLIETSAAHTGVPLFEYVNHLQNRPRPTDGQAVLAEGMRNRRHRWHWQGTFRLACYNVCSYILPMVLELKLRKIGNSVGVVLPKEALARLNVAEGDTLTLTDAPEGGLRVTPAAAGREQFARQMKAAESVIRRYRNTLRELAK